MKTRDLIIAVAMGLVSSAAIAAPQSGIQGLHGQVQTALSGVTGAVQGAGVQGPQAVTSNLAQGGGLSGLPSTPL
ncbi:MAG TPA: hypothetical protein VFA86_08835 [Gammaproteobacteria bacterium]|nr:hypothetical protein [Gammaproteobacteria bacterium]